MAMSLNRWKVLVPLPDRPRTRLDVRLSIMTPTAVEHAAPNLGMSFAQLLAQVPYAVHQVAFSPAHTPAQRSLGPPTNAHPPGACLLQFLVRPECGTHVARVSTVAVSM